MGGSSTHAGEDEAAEERLPVYSMQALWGGQLTMEEFQVEGAERPTLAHDVFEQQETLPVIDVAVLLGKDGEAKRRSLEDMVEAAKAWGFFKIRNHGVPLQVMIVHLELGSTNSKPEAKRENQSVAQIVPVGYAVKKVELNVKKFFELPMEKKLLVKAHNFVFGYIAGSPVSWRYKWWLERLHMKVHDEAIRNMVNLVWPDDKEFSTEFISDLTSYFGTMRELSRLIVEGLTEGLGLPREAFTKLETPKAICNAQVNHYPACPEPDSVFGIPAHTDPQMLSILYQDEVGGLQVLKDGTWMGIRPDASTFVVNLGDTLQVLSNGILHSPVHRVALNRTRSRYTTIYFYGIDNEASISAAPELVTKERPLKYRPFTVNEYRADQVTRQVPTDGLKYLEVQPPEPLGVPEDDGSTTEWGTSLM